VSSLVAVQSVNNFHRKVAGPIYLKRNRVKPQSILQADQSENSIACFQTICIMFGRGKGGKIKGKKISNRILQINILYLII